MNWLSGTSAEAEPAALGSSAEMAVPEVKAIASRPAATRIRGELKKRWDRFAIADLLWRASVWDPVVDVATTPAAGNPQAILCGGRFSGVA
jgi:hypothetical protein